MKKSFGLRAAQIGQLGVAESRRIWDMPSIRLLDLTNLVTLSPSKHFFNGLLAQIKRQASAESRRIPDWLDLGAVSGLRSEAADAERTAFVNNGRIFAEAAKTLRARLRRLPQRGARKASTHGFGDYITAHQWEGSTPLGGVWDSAVDAFGVAASR